MMTDTWNALHCIFAVPAYANNSLLFYLLTYLLTPRSRVLLEKFTGLQLVKKFPAFYGTRRFITAFKSARHLSLSWANSIQSIPPHPTSWRSILILSSHLQLDLPSVAQAADWISSSQSAAVRPTVDQQATCVCTRNPQLPYVPLCAVCLTRFVPTFPYREEAHCREANGTTDVNVTMLKRVNIFLGNLLRYIHVNSQNI